MTLLEPRAIGTPVARRDGVAKVTGTATYAYEHLVESPRTCIRFRPPSRGDG